MPNKSPSRPVGHSVDTDLVLLTGRSAAAETDTADQTLVLRAKAGQSEAREALARRFRRPAYLLALQISRNPDDALDIAQDALLRFFDRLHRFDHAQEVRPWLFAIVRNRARDLWRTRSARPSEPLESDPDLSLQVADPAPGPEQQADRQELRRQVWRAIGMLSRNHREILVIRDFHDLAYAEIARVLDVPVGTVMSRLHAARTALRTRLEVGEPDA